MVLSDFIQYLTNGELSQLSIGNVITNENLYPKIISGINLGVSELYKRFPIKVSRIELHLQEAINEYWLHSSKATSNMELLDDPLDFYVHDTLEAFTDNIIRIETIYDVDNTALVLNQPGNTESLTTVSHNKLWVPTPTDDTVLYIEYRASVPPISLDSDPDTVEVDIPTAFTEALVNYVAYRTFAAINMQSAEAVNYYAKFEASCALIFNLGLWNKDIITNERLENTGWV